jgi:hypothetical protein
LIKQIKEKFDVIERYRDPCIMISEKIVDVHVAVNCASTTTYT